jgi:hypothetical protein
MNILRNAFNVLKNGGPIVWRSIAVLVLLDFVFIGVYMVWGVMYVAYGIDKPPQAWDISLDFSASEIFNYSKWVFICVALAIAYARTRTPLFLSFSFVFALVLFDDMFQLHERGGDLIVQLLDYQPAFGLRAQDFGELSVWTLLGTVSLSVLIIGYFKSPVQARPFGSFFLLTLCGLVFTAIVIDMLGIIWDELASKNIIAEFIAGGLTILEDGGEMIIGSLGCGGAMATLLASREGTFSKAGLGRL